MLFWDLLIITLSCDFRVHRAGSQLKIIYLMVTCRIFEPQLKPITNSGVRLTWECALHEKISVIGHHKEAVPKLMGPDLMPALWSPSSWIADYCSRDRAVCPVSWTVICSVCTVYNAMQCTDTIALAAILAVGLNPSLRKIGSKLGLSPTAKIPAAANGVQYCRSVF